LKIAQQRKVGKRYILPLAKHCFAYFSLLSLENK